MWLLCWQTWIRRRRLELQTSLLIDCQSSRLRLTVVVSAWIAPKEVKGTLRDPYWTLNGRAAERDRPNEYKAIFMLLSTTMGSGVRVVDLSLYPVTATHSAH